MHLKSFTYVVLRGNRDRKGALSQVHQRIGAEKKIIRAEIASSPKSLARFLSVTMGFYGNVDKHGKIHLSKLPHYRFYR